MATTALCAGDRSLIVTAFTISPPYSSYLRCSIHPPKGHLILNARSIGVIARFYLILEVIMDNAGIIFDF